MSEWIPCSERLPESDNRVIVAAGVFVGEATRIKFGAWSSSGNITHGVWDQWHRPHGAPVMGVTHWQPLPTPPSSEAAP